MPCSRWAHIITQVRGDTKDDEQGFLMLGGVNLKSYCSSTLWNFTLHDQDETKTNKKKRHDDKSKNSLFGTGLYDPRATLSDRH